MTHPHKSLFSILIVVPSVCLTFSTAHAQTILYVDQNATGPTHDGWSWCTAFTDLQDALELAVYNVIIRVADGTYTPDRGTGARTATFQLTNTVAVEGGYAGCGAPYPNERDFELYETVLSGDLDDNDVGELDDPSTNENSYHVVTASSCDATAVVDGFTVTGGNADTSSDEARGGGMHNTSGSPTIVNCTFTRNSANSRGGGMYNDDHSSPAVTNCIFDGNSASNGGGMSTSGDSSPTVTNCTFSDNLASNNGGAIQILTQSNLVLANCLFRGNSAGGGGAMFSQRSDPTVNNCLFTGNSASSGGAIYLSSNTGSLVLTNCTFSRNSASNGRALYSEGANAQVSDCILWDGVHEVNGNNISITYSDIMGGWPGEGNVFAPPLFVDADGPDNIPGTEDDDLHLLPMSPCIDTGDPDYVSDPDETDLDGNPRVINDRVDMGAYESPSECSGDDFDGDGIPDMCDADIDDDGVLNDADVCDFTPVGAPVDSSGRPLMDIDEDCDTDLVDFALFQLGFTGPGG